MKNCEKSLMRSLYVFSTIFLVVLFSGGIAIETQAADISFSKGNSIATLDVSGGSGLHSYTVDGVDHLAKQWYYYRIGNTGPEYGLETLGAPTITSLSVSSPIDGYKIVYNNSAIEVTLNYWVQGNATLGSAKSMMHADWAVKNLTGTNMNFHMFQYSDFDLNGSTTDNSVLFSKFLVGPASFDHTLQIDGVSFLTNTFLQNRPITAVETGDAATILGKLTDLNTTTLGGPSSAFSGNLAYAAQWDMSLTGSGAGASGANNELWSLSGVLVPEPSSFALISFGLAVLALRQRGMRKGNSEDIRSN